MNDDLTSEERWLADVLADISRRRGPGRGFTPPPSGGRRRVGTLVLVQTIGHGGSSGTLGMVHCDLVGNG